MSPIEKLRTNASDLIPESLRSPEQLLIELENRILNVPETEKPRYRELIAKLKGMLESKKTGVIQEGKDILSEFRNHLSPEQKATLEKVQSGLNWGTENMQKVWENAVKALENADIQGVIWSAKEASVRVEAGAKQVLDKAQEAGMWVAIAQTFKTVAEGIGNMFQSLGEMFKKIFSMIAGIFGFKNLLGSTEGEKWAEKTNQTTTQNTPVKTIDTVEQRRQQMAESLKKAPEDFKNKLEKDLAQWGYSKNDRTKSGKFNEVWNEYKPEIEQLLKTNADAALHDAKHNPLDSLIKSVMIPTRMFMSLVAKWVIPLDAIATQVYDGAVILSLKSLRGMMQFGNNQMEGVLSRVSIANFGTEREKMNPDQKAVLDQIFVHNHVIGAYLLSIAGNAVAKAGAYTFAWKEGVGLGGLMANYRGVQGEWAKSALEMQKIATSIGATEDLAKIGVVDRNMQMVFQEAITKGLVTDAFSQAKNPADFLERMKAIQTLGQKEVLFSQNYFDKISQEVFKSKTLPLTLSEEVTMKTLSVELRQKIGQTLLKTESLWKFENIGNAIKGAFSRANTPELGAHFVDNVQQSLERVNKSMALSIEYKAEGKGFDLIWDRIKQAVWPSAFTEIAKNAQKGIIPIQLADSPQAIKAISNLAYEAPGLVSSFFKMFPLVVVGTSAVIADDKMKALQAGMIGLTPIIGPLILLHEGWEMKGLQFTNVSLIGLGITQLTIESVMFANLIRSSRSGSDFLLKSAAFVGRPITMTIDALKWAWQIMSLSRQTVSTIARGGGREIIQGAFRTGKAGKAGMALAAMAMATAVVAYGPEKLLNEFDAARSAEFMKKEGYIDADGGLNLALVKEKFAGFSADQRKKVVEYIASTSFGSDYSIDQKNGTKILVNGAVELGTIDGVRADLAEILGEKSDIQVSLSDTWIKSWYEVLKRESKNNIPAIKDTMMATLKLSADDLQKKLPVLFQA